MSKARQLADLGNVYDDGALSNRNRIINGNFDVWQRGTSGSSGYVADRWRTLVAGSTASISRQSFTLGQTDVPNEPEYFHRVAATSSAGATNYVVMQQRVEFVRTFAGQTVTLSFWAKADAGKNIAVEFGQTFGPGGSSFVSGIDVATCALTTSWQKFTVTANIPSISGATIGSQSSLDITFWFDAGSDYNSRSNSLGQQSGTFDISQVQLEVGDTATPFEHRLYGQELALCERYYEAGTFFFAGDVTLNGGYFNDTHFRTIKRANPTCTIVSSGGLGFVAGQGVVNNFDTTLIRILEVSDATTAAGYFLGTYTADAEL